MSSPYDEGDRPTHFEGRDACVAYFAEALLMFGPFRFDQLVVHDTTGDVVVAEWDGTAQLLPAAEPTTSATSPCSLSTTPTPS